VPVNRSPRHVARMPSFRAMAWLAWLILAMAPVHGMPGGMMGDAHQGAPVSSVAHPADHGQHAMPAQPDCCGDQGHGLHGSMGAAHCAAMCGSVLPAVAMTELVPVAPERLRISPLFAPTPSVVYAAPLRPPAG
jgi:hypothetical protein